jgi:hypothetical protein
MAGTLQPRWARRRAYFALALSVLAFGGSIILMALNGHVEHGATAAWNGWGEVLSWNALMLFAVGVGVLVALKRPGNRTAEVFLAGGALGIVTVLGDQYAGYALVTRPGGLPGGVAARMLSFLCFAATWFLAGVLLPAVFPTGRLVSRRWRLAVWLGAVGATMWGSLIFLPQAFSDDGLLGEVSGVSNPIGVGGLAGAVNTVSGMGILALFGGTFLAIGSMVVRAVRSRGEERQQIKVVAYTIAVTTVVQLVVANTLDLVSFPGSNVLWNVFSNLALLAIPVSIAVALMRYRLYDVDRLINKTLVYVLVTALLAGVYAGVVLGIGAITRPLTQGSDLAVAGATLMMVALFVPVRRRVQVFVDRRFYRTRYDAARTLEEFSSRLRLLTDLGTLQDEIESVAHRTMRPAAVGLWLAGERRPARLR